MSCVFCQIIAGELPSDILYQDEEVIAIRDINPLAPTHILVIPKEHIPSLTELTEAQIALTGHMVSIANQVAKSEGLAQSGYRLVLNEGKDAGQIVPHLHLHLLGGRKLAGGIG